MPEPRDDVDHVVVVVGIGADGWAGLSERLRRVVRAADVVIGNDRHLPLVPDTPGQERVVWPRPMLEAMPGVLAAYAGRRVVVVASGDPFVSGIASTLVTLLGPERVMVEPAVSSVALAGARMRWSADSVVVVRVIGPDASALRRELAPGRRILVLSSDETTPAALATLLVDCGHGRSRMTVLGDLGASDETRVDATADAWTGDSPRLNVVAIEVAGPGTSWVPGLPDDAFEHDGQLTKRDLRASALARLTPMPGQLLWDVGAGAGSVGIEWMRAHPSCRTIAVESDPERAARISRNADRLGVPSLAVVVGRAPDVLTGLEAPDAVFVGGGATRDGVIDACLAALRPGGRMVVHGVTVETETLLATLYAEHGGDLTRVSVETAAPIGTFTGWTPARAVTQWAYSR